MIAAVLLFALLLFALFVQEMLRSPYIAAAAVFCLLGLVWRKNLSPLGIPPFFKQGLAGLFLCGNIRSLALRFAPCLVAGRRLRRYVQSGGKARVVCFGRPEAGEEAGFYLAFDTVLRQDSSLRFLRCRAPGPRCGFATGTGPGGGGLLFPESKRPGNPAHRQPGAGEMLVRDCRTQSSDCRKSG